MRIRRVDENGDRIFGGDQKAFYRDQPEGVGLAAMNRLNLNLGSWFLDLEDGTAWQTRVLGANTADTRDPEIVERLASTEGVTSLTYYASQFDPNTRLYSVQATLDTIYGAAPVQGNV